VTATAQPRPQRVATPGAFAAIYKLILRNQVTIGRVVAVVAMSGLGILIGLAVGARAGSYPIEDGAKLVNEWTLLVTAPLISLVFASSAIGDLIDDKTLVYLWLRPVNRYLVAAAAGAASLTICLPAVVVPAVIMAALTKGGAELVLGTIVSSLVGVIAYVGIFLALGLRFRRALVWGLVYIILWEGFVANASKTANRLAIRGYTRSVLSEYTGVGFAHATLSLLPGIIVPIIVGLLFIPLTGHRLSRTTVD
jgi:ABC-2 type transport system permease protein